MRGDRRITRRADRRLNPYCVEVESWTMLAHYDEEGDIDFEWGAVTTKHVLYSRGPQEAEESIIEAYEDAQFTILSLRRVRQSMAHLMLIEDEYDPVWDYEAGVIEEYMESQEEYP